MLFFRYAYGSARVLRVLPSYFPQKENKGGREPSGLRCDSLPFGASQKFLGFQRGFFQKSPLAAGGKEAKKKGRRLPCALSFWEL